MVVGSHWQEHLIDSVPLKRMYPPESRTFAMLIGQTECGLPVREGHQALLANKMLIAVVFRVYCHCSVPQDCLRPGRSHRKVLLRVCYLVLEKVQMPCLFTVLNLHT